MGEQRGLVGEGAVGVRPQGRVVARAQGSRPVVDTDGDEGVVSPADEAARGGGHRPTTASRLDVMGQLLRGSQEAQRSGGAASGVVARRGDLRRRRHGHDRRGHGLLEHEPGTRHRPCGDRAGDHALREPDGGVSERDLLRHAPSRHHRQQDQLDDAHSDHGGTIAARRRRRDGDRFRTSRRARASRGAGSGRSCRRGSG